MRKTFLSIMAVAATVVMLHAEGYQLNLNSAKQGGMGNAGVALKLGAEGMIYNPASLSFINGSVDFAAGVTGVRSFITYTNGSYEAETKNPLGTPLYLYAGFKITDNLAAGVSLNNPAGNSIVWDNNWRGNEIVQKSSLQAFSVQPSLAFKFLDDKVSIGAGAMIMFGNFSTSKALVGDATLQLIGMQAPMYKPILDQFLGTTPMDITLSGKAKIGVGFNAGILFAPVPQFSIGVSYRHKVDLEVDKGETTINRNFTDPTLQAILSGAIPALDQAGGFTASMPIPSILSAGAAYHFGETGVVTAEVQWVGWGVFEELAIKYDNIETPITTQKQYINTFIYRVGGQFGVAPKFDVRVGAYYDTTPVDKEKFYSPETPGSNKLALTCGWSWRPVYGLSIDFAFVYSHGNKTTGNFTENPYVVSPFTGDYKVHAFLPSLGLSYRF